MSDRTRSRDRLNHESRTEGEDCPRTTEAAIRQAHAILAEAGAHIGPSKMAKLSRDYVAAGSPGSFRAYIVRNTKNTARSLPLAPRGHGVEWVDTTGETAADNADLLAGLTPADRARVEAHRGQVSAHV